MCHRFVLCCCVLIPPFLLGCGKDVSGLPAHDDQVEADASPATGQQSAESPVDASIVEAAQVISLFDDGGGHLAMSRDGKRLVMSGSREKDEPGVVWIVVYDVEQGETIREFESFSAGIVPVSISTDGKLVAYLTQANFVKIIDVETGETLHEFKNDDLTGYYSHRVQIAPDAKSVWTYVEGADIPSNLLGWNLETGEALPPLNVEGIVVQCLSIFPDCQHIAAGYHNGEIRIWNLEESESTQLAAGKEPKPALHDSARVSLKEVAVSPDGKHLVSGVMDQNPQLWSLESNELIRELPSGGGMRNDALSFDPSCRVIVCQGDWLTSEGETDYGKDGHPLHVYDVGTGERLAMLSLPGSSLDTGIAWNVAWCGTTLYAAMSSGKIHVFDLSQWLD